MAKVIGITGKVGTGKSFIGEYLARETGYRLVKLDYQVAQIVNRPIIKQIFQRRIRGKIPRAYKDIQLFPLWKNLDRDFTRFENWVVISALNKKLKKIIRKSNKDGRGIIVDFVALPSLAAIKKFDKIYVIKSEEQKRIGHMSQRDGLSAAQVQNVDRFLTRYYQKNDSCAFDGVIENNYQEIPETAKEIVNSLRKVAK